VGPTRQREELWGPTVGEGESFHNAHPRRYRALARHVRKNARFLQTSKIPSLSACKYVISILKMRIG